MAISEDIYKEIILEHYQEPSHCGHLENPTIVQEGVNRSCGDEVKIELSIQNNQIYGIRVNSRGCSISVASGSMMADAIEGMSVEESKNLIKQFKAMIIQQDHDYTFPENLEDLEALQGVKKYPIRVKCATLVWSTLEQAIMLYQERKKK